VTNWQASTATARAITRLRAGAHVAHGLRMIKPLLSAGVLVLTLCAPALAQPAKTAVPPMNLELTVVVGTETRLHKLVIADDSCGHVQAKARDFEDDIHVCSVTRGDGPRLEASWHVRDKTTEYTLSWTAAVARGGSIEAFPAGAKFTLAMK
jgi:hypothetical protein